MDNVTAAGARSQRLVVSEYDCEQLRGAAPELGDEHGGVGALLGARREEARAFHDETLPAEGAKVATRKTFHGSHQGEFMGIPPTGQQVSMELIDIVRIADGRVVEHWAVGDNLGMMQQLGIVPRPGDTEEASPT